MNIDFVGVGKAALSSIAIIDRPFGPDNPDQKADAEIFWEPELGTFAPIVCKILHRWGRNVALISSIAGDNEGFLLRHALRKRGVPLLFVREIKRTERQFAFTPKGYPSLRYNLDVHTEERKWDARAEQGLQKTIDLLLGTKWIAFDKYEGDLVMKIFESERWQSASERPTVMFETGSRPLCRTLASDQARKVFGEPAYMPYIDVLTTTWEWIIDAADLMGINLSGEDRKSPPDAWEDPAREMHFKELLKNISLLSRICG